MDVLLTGAFGNVGTSAIEELLKQGHRVRCFDLKTRANERKARKYSDRIEVTWGDLRNPDDVAAAVRDQDVVVHLAFIIPKLSATGFESEDRPDWAREINVGGTRSIIAAMQALPHPPRLIFSSSYHVYGQTHDQPPPRTVYDPVDPIEHYACHKVECEGMVRASGLEWSILRFAAVLPLSLRLDPGMYDIPPDNRMGFTPSAPAQKDMGAPLITMGPVTSGRSAPSMATAQPAWQLPYTRGKSRSGWRSRISSMKRASASSTHSSVCPGQGSGVNDTK